MPTYPEVVTGNIAAARARRKLSQKALAERMDALGYGWRQQTVAAIEGRRREVAVGELLGLAYALETSVPALLDTGHDGQVTLPSGIPVDPASVGVSSFVPIRKMAWDDNTPTSVEVNELGQPMTPALRAMKEFLDKAVAKRVAELEGRPASESPFEGT